MTKRTISVLFLVASACLATLTNAHTPEAERVLSQVDGLIEKARIDKSNPAWRSTVPRPEVASFSTGYRYFARIQTTRGAVRVRLNPGTAPQHVTGVIYLARLGFYDGLPISALVPAVSVSAGLEPGEGSALGSGPGYSLAPEFTPLFPHDRAGLLSISNAGLGSDGSQIVLTLGPAPALDGLNSVIGEVTEGMDFLPLLAAAPDGVEPLRIERMTIEVAIAAPEDCF